MGQLQFGVRGMDLHHLFVKHELRGQGVGPALIDAAIGLSKAMSCQYLTVGTHVDNKVAAQVYLKAGFDPLPNSGPRFRMRLDR
jgi:GNAT superfamily N-acetyltransferase